MVLEPFPAFDQAEIPNYSVMAAAHSSELGALEIVAHAREHPRSMHCRPIPSTTRVTGGEKGDKSEKKGKSQGKGERARGQNGGGFGRGKMGGGLIGKPRAPQGPPAPPSDFLALLNATRKNQDRIKTH